MPRTHTLLLPSLFGVVVLLAACDTNVGVIFDPNGPGGGSGAESNKVVVPIGGDTRSTRPRVVDVQPKGDGWPGTVPIVVTFSQSMSLKTLQPTTTNGTDARLFVRIQGTTQAIPAVYDLMDGGRTVVVRSTLELTNPANTPYEVVLRAESRDVDGLRTQSSSDEVIAEFTTDAPAESEDGEVVAVVPRSGQTGVHRESDVFVFFSRAANLSSVTSTSLRVRASGGADLTGAYAAGLNTLGVDDTRVVRFRPASQLAASQRYDLILQDTITFGEEGTLQLPSRSPFSSFTASPVGAPESVVVGNPVAGFPDKINRANAQNLALHVEVPADTAAGDTVVARVYGQDASTSTADDVTYVERTATVATAGNQVVTVDFSGALGTLDRPAFGDGEATLTAQMRRGDSRSGYIHNAAANQPIFDLTAPTLVRVGPPGVTTGNVFYTDQNEATLYGKASERLSLANLATSTASAAMHASAADGTFFLGPVALNRTDVPVPFSLALTDLAGNSASAAVDGQFVQRGFTSGTVGSSLEVEVYDDATFDPVSGAIVVLDAGAPTVPPTGRLVATTGANGRVLFTGLTAAVHTITAVRSGYHLVTLYESPAAFASLPLRPQQGATAVFRGTVGLLPTAGTSALVGNSAFDDPALLAVATTTAAPNVLPATNILANRPQLLSGFAGNFEPVAAPTYTQQGNNLNGTTGLTLGVPGPPLAAGADQAQSLQLGVALTGTGSLANGYLVDFATATGLDTASLVGGKPLVRVMGSFTGFGGQVLSGVGFASSLGGASYNVGGNFSTALSGLSNFLPLFWVATEARDTAGRISRHRGILDPANGGVFAPLTPLGIPVLTAPTAPVGTAPAITFNDVLDPAIPPVIALADLLLQDTAARQWRVLTSDTDAAGGTVTVQLPDLSGTGATGLANGTWSARVESRIFLSTSGATAGRFVLAERRRQEINYARSLAVTFAVP
ncbi:MAG: hypothetical protein RL148_3098 [Planctomycetota bacterium]